MAGGRPRIFKTPQEMQREINKYFKYCEENNKPPTYAGIARKLGMDRKTFYSYEDRDEVFHTIKEARDKIAEYIEEILIAEGRAGQIFYAKNYGYKDQQQIDTNVTIVKGLEDWLDE